MTPLRRPPATRLWGWIAWGVAAPLLFTAFAAVVGLAAARRASPAVNALAATTWVLLPGALAGAVARRDRRETVPLIHAVWATVVLTLLPVYAPRERATALRTGLAMLLGPLGEDGALGALAAWLPEEPAVSTPPLPVATPVLDTTPPPSSGPLADHEIALPYEGEGRRLSVPVVFEHGGVAYETQMMLDTGATYTTLNQATLSRLGRTVPADAPVLTLSTANGERRAPVVLLDEVWLGDLKLRNVAVTLCDDCAQGDVSGLLGLNVAGGFNVTINADHREVVFAARGAHDRRLDIRPFAKLRGGFRRFPGGAVEAALVVENAAERDVGAGTIEVSCGGVRWNVPFEGARAREAVDVAQQLPPHPGCDVYELSLGAVWWAEPTAAP
jgi:clan AA aspartic protease (TIGR02281 family)